MLADSLCALDHCHPSPVFISLRQKCDNFVLLMEVHRYRAVNREGPPRDHHSADIIVSNSISVCNCHADHLLHNIPECS